METVLLGNSRQSQGWKEVLCTYYEGKTLFTGMLHQYAEIHREMNESALREDAKSSKFHGQRRRKRRASYNEIVRAKKSHVNLG
jgi:hypothetical protein